VQQDPRVTSRYCDPFTVKVMAWLIDAAWQFQPDKAKASDVEVRFTPAGDGTTLVEVEHRNFERAGAGWESMRQTIDSPGGWNGNIRLFAAAAEEQAQVPQHAARPICYSILSKSLGKATWPIESSRLISLATAG
jgi:hypothetical protein